MSERQVMIVLACTVLAVCVMIGYLPGMVW